MVDRTPGPDAIDPDIRPSDDVVVRKRKRTLDTSGETAPVPDDPSLIDQPRRSSPVVELDQAEVEENLQRELKDGVNQIKDREKYGWTIFARDPRTGEWYVRKGGRGREYFERVHSGVNEGLLYKREGGKEYTADVTFGEIVNAPTVSEWREKAVTTRPVEPPKDITALTPYSDEEKTRHRLELTELLNSRDVGKHQQPFTAAIAQVKNPGEKVEVEKLISIFPKKRKDTEPGRITDTEKLAEIRRRLGIDPADGRSADEIIADVRRRFGGAPPPPPPPAPPGPRSRPRGFLSRFFHWLAHGNKPRDEEIPTNLKEWVASGEPEFESKNERLRAMQMAIFRRRKVILNEATANDLTQQFARSLYKFTEGWKKHTWARIGIGTTILTAGLLASALAPAMLGLTATTALAWRGVTALGTGAMIYDRTREELEKRNFVNAKRWAIVTGLLAGGAVLGGGYLMEKMGVAGFIRDKLGLGTVEPVSGPKVEPSPVDQPEIEETPGSKPAPKDTPSDKPRVKIINAPEPDTSATQPAKVIPEPQEAQRPRARPQARVTINDEFFEDRPRTRVRSPLAGEEPRFGTSEWWRWYDRRGS